MLVAWLGSRVAREGGAMLLETAWWGMAYILFGLVLSVWAISQFFGKKTTVNPLDPQQASSLVDHGVFAYTRNPMYLGMVLLFMGQIIWLGWSPAFLLLVAFVVYIQVFQIHPEERAMLDLFGDEYRAYCQKVRRWL